MEEVFVIEGIFVQDLRLKEEGRELVYKGSLKKRGGTQSDSGDLQVFLFDHALLMVKQKSKHEQHKVYRRVNYSLMYPQALDNEAARIANTIGASYCRCTRRQYCHATYLTCEELFSQTQFV